MSETRTLYTPQLLALAVELGSYPAREDLAFHGEGRSQTCGSTVAMDLGLDDDGRVDSLGMRVRACAVGQASAAIFARAVMGLDIAAIRTAQDAISAWLNEDGPLPEWPGFAVLEPAQAYPGRHGAILLPWKSALTALSTSAG
ncbi:NifU-like protein involved in Fe-S cluster formation [Altererythrobacter atlanticus]|uniref:Uncharacterized protein n=1 Tax=Croceibacterium atlanticum TaxID=1267766 RepID=A0A0F7KS51_9SPHN|nr:iron-sulfur cluster assembly scaffold protein [Croceibacterium atlanticum]AKH41585.1 hypothetical protein WYH_00526 [Croceibacterium atlanticum]MBB5733047.1 NifU-like protein involved in Fe-S cluster formation [Croceibacterium atlanticum]